MRRKDKEIKDPKIIEEILAKSVICRLAMIDGDQPYLLPFNYGYANNAIYIHCASSGRKIDILKRNNKVCFEIEYFSEIIKERNACDWTTRYRSVIGYGTVEIFSDPATKKHGLDIIMQHNGRKENNTYEASFERIVIIKLSIDSISAKQSGNWD